METKAQPGKEENVGEVASWYARPGLIKGRGLEDSHVAPLL